MKAVQYTRPCYEMYCGEYMTYMFIPELKLTFDEKLRVWKSNTIDIPESKPDDSDDRKKQLEEINESIIHTTIPDKFADLLKILLTIECKSAIVRHELVKLYI